MVARSLLPLAAAIAVSLLARRLRQRGICDRAAADRRRERFTLTAGAVGSAALPCGAPAAAPFGVHLELFVDAWVVLVPSGIGIRQPWVGSVPYVESGACEHPIVTREPTGVIEVAGPGHTLGDLFAVWGQPLGPDGFAQYRGSVTAHVDGHLVGRRSGCDPAQPARPDRAAGRPPADPPACRLHLPGRTLSKLVR